MSPAVRGGTRLGPRRGPGCQCRGGGGGALSEFSRPESCAVPNRHAAGLQEGAGRSRPAQAPLSRRRHRAGHTPSQRLASILTHVHTRPPPRRGLHQATGQRPATRPALRPLPAPAGLPGEPRVCSAAPPGRGGLLLSTPTSPAGRWVAGNCVPPAPCPPRLPPGRSIGLGRDSGAAGGSPCGPSTAVRSRVSSLFLTPHHSLQPAPPHQSTNFLVLLPFFLVTVRPPSEASGIINRVRETPQGIPRDGTPRNT